MKEKGEAYVNPFILEMLHQVITSTDLDFEQKKSSGFVSPSCLLLFKI